MKLNRRGFLGAVATLLAAPYFPAPRFVKERARAFREAIVYLAPLGDAPLMAMLKGAKRVKDPEFKWYTKEMCKEEEDE